MVPLVFKNVKIYAVEACANHKVHWTYISIQNRPFIEKAKWVCQKWYFFVIPYTFFSYCIMIVYLYCYTGEPLSSELPPHWTAIQQAAPPAEHVPTPEVNFPPSAVVSFSLDECLPSLAQSARVEPSPERIYTLSSCAEEDEATSPLSASSGQC